MGSLLWTGWRGEIIIIQKVEYLLRGEEKKGPASFHSRAFVIRTTITTIGNYFPLELPFEI